MRELSLFSGAGGGLLGTLLMGWTPIGYVEYDDYCQRVIAQRIRDGILPIAPIFGDVRAFIGDGYAAAYTGLVDVVTGGFPCQPFSVAGRQLGADDPRNMWPATIEVIRVVRPRFCFLENVPGLLSSGYFGTILGDLAESGYDCRWRVLSAAEVGAPHKRDRLWICAYAQGERTRRVSIRQGRPQQASTDTDGMGREGRRLPQRTPEEVSRPGINGEDVSNAQHNGHGWGQQSTQSSQRERDLYHPSWWEIEPQLGRLAHGIPNRVERLRAAGNAQVPAVVRAAWHLLTADLIPPQPIDDFAELEDYWPSLEEVPDGVDVFAEKYGPPTGGPQ